MPGTRGAEKRAYAGNHEFCEHRATLQMSSAAVLQRSGTISYLHLQATCLYG